MSKKLFDLRDDQHVSYAHLNEKFKDFAINESLSKDDMYIQYDTCVKAKKVTDYYLRIKKILAGYDPIKNKTYIENSS